MKKILIFTVILMLFLSCDDSSEQGSFDEISLKETESKILEMGREIGAELKIDKSITAENAIVFESVDEMRRFLKNEQEFLENIPVLEYIKDNKEYELLSTLRIPPCDDINGIYSGRAMASGYSELNYSMSVNNGRVTDVDGSLSGTTLGISYDDDLYTSQTSSTTISAVAQGTMSLNLFYQGLGTIYSYPVRYRLSINCLTSSGNLVIEPMSMAAPPH